MIFASLKNQNQTQTKQKRKKEKIAKIFSPIYMRGVLSSTGKQTKRLVFF
jgi:hypothetical protein